MDCSKFVMNPYILLYKNITIYVWQILYIPIKTNVTVTWSASNTNVFVAYGYIKANRVGTSIIMASANNLFSQTTVTIVPNMKKMIFT
jgi:hypothetical protein